VSTIERRRPEDAAAFADRDDPTRGHVAQRLRPALGPNDVKTVGAGSLAEAEVRAQVAL